MHEGHRERMLLKLSDKAFLYEHEVLEILLFYVRPRVNTNPLAHMLLDRFGTLKGVFSAKAEDLKEVGDVGDEVVAYLNLIGELYDYTRNSRASFAVSRNFNELFEIVDSRFSKMRKGYIYLLFFKRSGELRCVFPFVESEMFETSCATFRRLLALIKPFGVVAVHCRGDNEYSVKEECMRLISLGTICNAIECVIYNYFVYEDGVLINNFRYDSLLSKVYDSVDSVNLLASLGKDRVLLNENKKTSKDTIDYIDEDINGIVLEVDPIFNIDKNQRSNVEFKAKYEETFFVKPEDKVIEIREEDRLSAYNLEKKRFTKAKPAKKVEKKTASKVGKVATKVEEKVAGKIDNKATKKIEQNVESEEYPQFGDVFEV